MSKRPRFWFLIWLLPAITLYCTRLQILTDAEHARRETAQQAHPAALTLSCEIYVKGKHGQAVPAPNIGHHETIDPSGLPSAAAFEPAPFLCDHNVATGYPVTNAGSRYMPASYVLYSFPTDQALTRVVLQRTCRPSAGTLNCYYCHSEDGVNWSAATFMAGIATCATGTASYDVHGTAKYHMILMSYDGPPATLAITEALMRSTADPQ